MNKQPEALHLADELDVGDFDVLTNYEAAAELRRLHEENERLKIVPMKYRRMEFNAQLQEENKRLHEVNQELLEALQRIKHHFDTDEYAWKIAVAAITKAGEQP